MVKKLKNEKPKNSKKKREKKVKKQSKITLKLNNTLEKTIPKEKKKNKKEEKKLGIETYEKKYIKNKIKELNFFFLLKNKKLIILSSNKEISTYDPLNMNKKSSQKLTLYLSHLLELSNNNLIGVSNLKLVYYNILENGNIQIINEMNFIVPHQCIGAYQINNNTVIIGREGKIHFYDINNQTNKKTIMLLHIGKYKKSKFSLNENSSIKNFFYQKDSNNIVLISNICLYFMNIETKKIYSRLNYGNEYRKFVDLGFENKNKLCIYTQSNVRIYDFNEGKELFKFIPDYAISIVVKGKKINEIIISQKNGFICFFDFEKYIKNHIFQISKCTINFIFYVSEQEIISNAEKNNFIFINVNNGIINQKINVENAKDYRKMISLDNGNLIFGSGQNFLILTKKSI